MNLHSTQEYLCWITNLVITSPAIWRLKILQRSTWKSMNYICSVMSISPYTCFIITSISPRYQSKIGCSDDPDTPAHFCTYPKSAWVSPEYILGINPAIQRCPRAPANPPPNAKLSFQCSPYTCPSITHVSRQYYISIIGVSTRY